MPRTPGRPLRVPPQPADTRQQVIDAAVARVVENITASLRAMVPEHAIRRLIELEVRAAVQALPPVMVEQTQLPHEPQPQPGLQPSSAPPTDRIAYRVKEAARLLGVSRAKLYDLVANGDLRVVKRGGMTFVRRVDLEAFIDAMPAPRGGTKDG